MNMIPSGIPIFFEVTFDRADLYVGMTVYDLSTGLPIAAVAAMGILDGNTYVRSFVPVDQKKYLVIKKVYLDALMTIPDNGYIAGSETVFATTFQNMTLIQDELAILLGRSASAQFLGVVTGNLFNTSTPGSTIPQPAQIIQGAKTALLARFLNQQTLDPFDLNGITDIQTSFRNEDGSVTTLSLIGGAITLAGDPLIGKILITITAAQSDAFEPTSGQTMEFSFFFGVGVDPVKVQVLYAYDIVESIP